jgi:DeoR/GlpR family transcriptional regulator of sugar metabolism
MARQAQILELIQTRGFQSVRDLANELKVDESTVRRHLYKLESLALINRTHGGASPVESAETPSRIKQTIHSPEKKKIGQAMAEKLLDGQVILLDSGSTTLEVAKALKNRVLTVVTNDLAIGIELQRKPNINIVFIGGEILANLNTTWGPTAVEQIKRLRVDVGVFGVDSVSANGVFNNTSNEIESKQAMMAISGQAYFVADSSKFTRKALFKVFNIDQFTAGITDDSLDEDVANQIPLPIIRVGSN